MMISDLLCVNRDSLVDVHVHVLCYEKVSLVSLGLFLKLLISEALKKAEYQLFTILRPLVEVKAY